MSELITKPLVKCREFVVNHPSYFLYGITGLSTGLLLYKTWRYFYVETTDSKFYRLKPSENPRKRKVLVIGLDDSGKTTFTRAFCKRRHRLDPTAERPIGEHIKHNEVTIGDLSVCMFNVDGSIYAREMWKELFNLDQLDCIIYCVDSSNTSRFVEARRELHKFLRTKQIMHLPLILLATKQDQVNAVEPYTLYLTMNLETFQDTRPIHYVGVQISSLSGRTQGFIDVYHILATLDKHD